VQNIAVIFHPSKISRAKIEAAFSKAGFPNLVYFPSDHKTGGLKATKKAIEAGANHIIVAGGDGTVRACVQAVFEEEAAVSLGLVPIGTGNILARNLKLPINNLDKCIKRSVSGDTYEIDLGVAKAINQHGELTKFYFTGIAGIGMDARIMQRTLPELKRRVGWIAYLEGGLRSLPMKFEKFEVLVDDQAPRNLKSYSILIGNAGWLPGQISMMPDARLDDGKLDVAAIGPRKIWNWVDFFARVTWQNKVVRPLALGRKWMDLTANLKTIENLGGSRIRVKPHHLSPLQLDGDVIGEVLEVDFSLKHKVLKIRL
jgi:diacylglycerol kinase family enzyme